MKSNFFLVFLSFIFLTVSCATADKVQNQNNEQPEEQTESEPQPVELKKKKSLADEIIVRDIYSKEEYPLSKIAQKRASKFYVQKIKLLLLISTCSSIIFT